MDRELVTEKEVRAICEDRRKGITWKEIARLHGRGLSTVTRAWERGKKLSSAVAVSSDEIGAPRYLISYSNGVGELTKRFTAKEAVVKALSDLTGKSGVRDIRLWAPIPFRQSVEFDG